MQIGEKERTSIACDGFGFQRFFSFQPLLSGASRAPKAKFWPTFRKSQVLLHFYVTIFLKTWGPRPSFLDPLDARPLLSIYSMQYPLHFKQCPSYRKSKGGRKFCLNFSVYPIVKGARQNFSIIQDLPNYLELELEQIPDKIHGGRLRANGGVGIASQGICNFGHTYLARRPQ